MISKSLLLGLLPLIFIFLIALSIVILPSSGSLSSIMGKPVVAVSIYPAYDLVRQISGDQIDVILLLPPGSSPHTFQPDPQVAKQISQANLVFLLSHGIDDWALKLVPDQTDTEIVLLDQNISLLTSLEHHHDDDHDDEYEDDEHLELDDDLSQTDLLIDAPDPHYWLSLANASIMADTILRSLSDRYPEHATDFQANALELQTELTSLRQQVLSRRSQLPDEIAIATFHNAWQYFAQDADISIAAVFELYPGDAPSPDYLKEFQDILASAQISAIFIEPQLSPTRLTPLLEDQPLPLGVLDPLGGESDRSTYLEVMDYNYNQVFLQYE